MTGLWLICRMSPRTWLILDLSYAVTKPSFSVDRERGGRERDWERERDYWYPKDVSLSSCSIRCTKSRPIRQDRLGCAKLSINAIIGGTCWIYTFAGGVRRVWIGYRLGYDEDKSTSSLKGGSPKALSITCSVLPIQKFMKHFLNSFTDERGLS